MGEHNAERVALIGGPFGGHRAALTRTPQRIDVGGHRYERINDPDTGESLGGYMHRIIPPETTEARGIDSSP